MGTEGRQLQLSLRQALASHEPSPGGDGGRNLVTSLFLASAAQALAERHWILSRDLSFRQPDFESFVDGVLKRELKPLGFLAPVVSTDLSRDGLKRLSRAALLISNEMIAEAARYDEHAARPFLRQAIRTMAEICAFEEGLGKGRSESFLPPSTYRAFDAFDEIFRLIFESDDGMKTPTGERLYVGGGAGVQTSYATILAALENLRLPTGGHLIDLGSGFGRVGLVAGLWRRDVRFTGYEYVEHRVRISNDSAERAGIAERVRFFAQDLGDAEFRIPRADAYYLYDPFCAETYARVLRQLNEMSREHAIIVVTKADAGSWFRSFESEGSWRAPESHDSGHLLMFRSR